MKTLGVVRICGVEVPVKAGDEDDNADLKSAYGCYDVDTSTLWLEDGLPKHTADFWFTHETLHALLNLSGALYSMAASLGMKRDDPRIGEWEEAFVRQMTPHILETFGRPKTRKP